MKKLWTFMLIFLVVSLAFSDNRTTWNRGLGINLSVLNVNDLTVNTITVNDYIVYNPVVQTLAGASTIGSVSAGGAVDDGDHYYRVTYVTIFGESQLGTISAVATAGGGNNTVNLTSIPVSSEFGVTSRRVYRTKAAYPSAYGVLWREYFLVTTLSDNVTTTYTDAAADVVLGLNYERTRQENLALGRNALASANTVSNAVAIGAEALQNTTAGNNNTAVGIGALKNHTGGDRNTAVGAETMFNNTTGSENDAFGQLALYNNTTGSRNTAIGEFSLFYNTTGTDNVGVGVDALGWLATGNDNVGLGRYAFIRLNNGDENLAAGSLVGRFVITGSRNVLLGTGIAGNDSVSNINNNVIIGHNAGFQLADDCSSNVFLGYHAGAFETTSDKLHITNAYDNTPLIYGDFNTDKLTFNGDVLVEKSSLYVTDATGADSITIYDDGSNAIIASENPLLFSPYTRHVDINANSAIVGVTAPTAVTLGTFRGLAFDADAEVVYFAFHVPTDWNGSSDMLLYVHWFSESGDVIAQNETVKWDATYRSVVPGEAADNGAVVTATTTFTGGASEIDKETYETTITIDYDHVNQPLTAGDEVGFQFDRDVSGDTYPGDATVFEWHIEFISIALPEN